MGESAGVNESSSSQMAIKCTASAPSAPACKPNFMTKRRFNVRMCCFRKDAALDHSLQQPSLNLGTEKTAGAGRLPVKGLEGNADEGSHDTQQLIQPSLVLQASCNQYAAVYDTMHRSPFTALHAHRLPL